MLERAKVKGFQSVL